MPLEIIVNQTQEAIFTCEAYGIPLPTIIWTKESDGTIVNNTDFIIVTETVIPPTTLRSVLRFVQVFNSDESVYICETSNEVPNLIGSVAIDQVLLLVQGMLLLLFQFL